MVSGAFGMTTVFQTFTSSFSNCGVLWVAAVAARSGCNGRESDGGYRRGAQSEIFMGTKISQEDGNGNDEGCVTFLEVPRIEPRNRSFTVAAQ